VPADPARHGSRFLSGALAGLRMPAAALGSSRLRSDPAMLVLRLGPRLLLVVLVERRKVVLLVEARRGHHLGRSSPLTLGGTGGPLLVPLGLVVLLGLLLRLVLLGMGIGLVVWLRLVPLVLLRFVVPRVLKHWRAETARPCGHMGVRKVAAVAEVAGAVGGPVPALGLALLGLLVELECGHRCRGLARGGCPWR